MRLYTVAEQVARITVDDVLSAYSGRVARCACGCSGTWSYTDAALGEAHRGYAVDPDEVSLVRVANVLRKIQASPSEAHLVTDRVVSLDTETRTYVVTLKETER